MGSIMNRMSVRLYTDITVNLMRNMMLMLSKLQLLSPGQYSFAFPVPENDEGCVGVDTNIEIGKM